MILATAKSGHSHGIRPRNRGLSHTPDPKLVQDSKLQATVRCPQEHALRIRVVNREKIRVKEQMVKSIPSQKSSLSPANVLIPCPGCNNVVAKLPGSLI